MFSTKTILVPVDFSETARKAISAAIQLAERSSARVIFLHVEASLQQDVTEVLTEEQGDTDAITTVMAEREAALRQAIDLEFQRAVDAGTPIQRTEHTMRISGGDWVEVAERIIREEEVDLVVAATHGGEHSGLRGLLLRPDAERLLSRAPCSVFVVRPSGFPYLRD